MREIKFKKFKKNNPVKRLFGSPKFREIKFRAWETRKVGQEKRMFSWEDICSGSWCIGLIAIFQKDSPIIPMEYIGLKDKNGKEIYENDLVKLYSNEIGEVVFHFPDGDNNIYGFVIKTKNSWIGLNTMVLDGEVIGNIYENSNLTT